MEEGQIHQTSMDDERQEKLVWKRDFPPLLQGFYFQLLAGLNDANLGIILPSIKAQFGLNQYVVSIVFLCTTLGYMLAAVANGYLIRRFSQVTSAMIGSISLVLGYLLFSCAIPFPVLCVFMICIGFGLALIQTFYGFGALIGPLIASSVSNWKGTYQIFCGMAGLNIVLQLFTFHDYRKQEKQQQSTDREERQQQEGQESVSNRLIYDTLHQPILYTGAVFLLLYVGTEVCIGNWGYTFLLSRNSDAVAMARIMAGYWGGICAGRLTLGWLTLKWGEKRMIYGYVCVLIGMLLLLYLVPFVSVNATALVIIGITIGPLFPTTVAVTSKVVPERLRVTTIGFLCAFGSGGSALFPYVGGVLIGSLGVSSLLPFCISLSSMMLISWLFVPNPEHSKPPIYRRLLDWIVGIGNKMS
ncbi:hypothetical protein [Absidia glauca]|uniref:Major facilitator superfamily (MFS) profile domain-containing protein n=1 Tax=Absidia glauca TaxID=4829 RepID=A0A163IS20_ABSGL|nr:hypothetical protein [Absidia glauca]